MTNESLIEFPCEFPIKIMGKDTPSFRSKMHKILEKHVGPINEESIKVNVSSNANFVAITITITAHSQQQLDQIYYDVTSYDDVLIAL